MSNRANVEDAVQGGNNEPDEQWRIVFVRFPVQGEICVENTRCIVRRTGIIICV